MGVEKYICPQGLVCSKHSINIRGRDEDKDTTHISSPGREEVD